MSETNRAAAASIEMKAKDKEKKDKVEDKTQDGPDPYCCTPPGGGTGPDTKP